MIPREPKQPRQDPYETDDDFRKRMIEYRQRYEEYEQAYDDWLDSTEDERKIRQWRERDAHLQE